MNIKPKAPQLNAYIKTHKGNAPIRPVINHTQAPSHKLARHLNRKLRELLHLPNIYNVKNSQEIAEELTNIWINDCMRLITLDIKTCMSICQPRVCCTQQNTGYKEA